MIIIIINRQQHRYFQGLYKDCSAWNDVTGGAGPERARCRHSITEQSWWVNESHQSSQVASFSWYIGLTTKFSCHAQTAIHSTYITVRRQQDSVWLWWDIKKKRINNDPQYWHQQWSMLQASLRVRNGGLGIRRAEMLATSAFLASAAYTLQFQNKILPDPFEIVKMSIEQKRVHLGPSNLKQRSHLNCFGPYRKCGMDPLHQPFRRIS